eukprot:gb/GECH01003141.1/.p1 GENE.gb/GECH01003141.1/~~gb/GECH01003141.1/.p1  ORF type:complete len:254 (+),score=57.40 gb/GECH01003141.1/:1-762(+)
MVAPSTHPNSVAHNRMLTLEATAYSSVVSAFRAQGELTMDKIRLLDDLRSALHIGSARHRCELLRAECDPSLQRIAVHSFDQHRQQLLSTGDTTPADVSERPSSTAPHPDPLILAHSDTESDVSEDEQHRRPRRGRRQGSRKRGRSATRRSSQPEDEPPSKRARGGRRRGAGRRSSVSAPAKREVAVVDGNTSIEEIERIAMEEHQEIERLERQLKDTEEPTQVQSIHTKLEDHREKLVELIRRLEQPSEGDE